jgi:hypothetical protein
MLVVHAFLWFTSLTGNRSELPVPEVSDKFCEAGPTALPHIVPLTPPG